MNKMKRMFISIISIILVLLFVVSAVAPLLFAEDAPENVPAEIPDAVVDRITFSISTPKKSSSGYAMSVKVYLPYLDKTAIKDKPISDVLNGGYVALNNCDFTSFDNAYVGTDSNQIALNNDGSLEVTFNNMRYNGSETRNVALSLSFFVANEYLASNYKANGNAPGRQITHTLSATAFQAEPYQPAEPETPETPIKDPVPVVIISNYSYGGGNVVAGQTFQLSFSIYNTSKEFALSNMKLVVNTGEQFVPVSSSNSFYIETLPENSYVTKTIQLRAASDATPGSFPVIIESSFEYLTETDRNSSNSTETITIPVVQTDRFSLGELEMMPEFPLGSPNQGYISFINKGKSSVYNLSASIEGENIQNPGQQTYIGNLQPGEENGYDFEVIPNEEGPVSGVIVFTYEDANGQAQEKRVEFSGTAIDYSMEPGIIDPLEPSVPVDGQIEENGGLSWIWIMAVMVVVAGIVLTVVLVKRKKAKRSMQEDEDF